jgi:hypothetical protein
MTIIDKIQTFETTKIWDLQRLVNDFLKTKESTDIVDIKYNQSPIRLGKDEFEESITEYTAMVIYSDWEDKEDEDVDSVPEAVDKKNQRDGVILAPTRSQPL